MNKTHKGTKKRVKVTGGNKFMALGSGKERKLGKKSAAQKRGLKTFTEVSETKTKKLRKLLVV